MRPPALLLLLVRWSWPRRRTPPRARRPRRPASAVPLPRRRAAAARVRPHPVVRLEPGRGALRYEFELATSNTFRENGMIYADRELKTPGRVDHADAAVDHRLAVLALRARPRGLADGATTVEQAASASTCARRRRRGRWRAILGPAALDAGRGRGRLRRLARSTSRRWSRDPTNVVDQREFYTFHQGSLVDVEGALAHPDLRSDTGIDGGVRANGLPAVQYGPWSPVYESREPAVRRRAAERSRDRVRRRRDGQVGDRAHRLMPAFVYSGNRASPAAAELYRVYVFTDRDCVNRVFTGAIVGSPAYAPRSYGPLALPKDTRRSSALRNTYLGDGDQGSTYAEDGEPITPNESLAAASPTVLLAGVGTDTKPPTGSGDDADDDARAEQQRRELSDRERRPRRTRRPLGHELAGGRLLLDGRPRRGRRRRRRSTTTVGDPARTSASPRSPSRTRAASRPATSSRRQRVEPGDASPSAA